MQKFGEYIKFVVESICEGVIPSRAAAMMGRNEVRWRDILK